MIDSRDRFEEVRKWVAFQTRSVPFADPKTYIKLESMQQLWAKWQVTALEDTRGYLASTEYVYVKNAFFVLHRLLPAFPDAVNLARVSSSSILHRAGKLETCLGCCIMSCCAHPLY